MNLDIKVAIDDTAIAKKRNRWTVSISSQACANFIIYLPLAKKNAIFVTDSITSAVAGITTVFFSQRNNNVENHR